MITLTAKQEKIIQDHITKHRDRLVIELSDSGWGRERRERTKLFQDLLNVDQIDHLTEIDFGAIFFITSSTWLLKCLRKMGYQGFGPN
jgi:hypothetical protein